MSTGHAKGAEIEMTNRPNESTTDVNRLNETDHLIQDEYEEQGEGVEEGALEESDMLGTSSARRRSIAHSSLLGDDASMTGVERRMARREFWRSVITNGTLIGLWYLFSISITVYNKWMFNSEDSNRPMPVPDPDDGSLPIEEPPHKKVVFPFPLFTTCVHMLVQFCLATLVLYIFPHFRPSHDSVDPHHPHHHRRDRENSRERDPKQPIMTYWFYLTRITPCGAATSLDIGLGNMSFKYITLTFYTMCKSSVLGFVLLFAFIFRLEKPSWKLGGIIATMTVGVFLMVAGEAKFNVTGFGLIMSSAASSGFRWSLTQILLIRNPATSNPFSSIFFLAPIMFLTLLILALGVEEIGTFLSAFSELGKERGAFASFAIVTFPGCLAFLMTASEFALLQRTSVVTLSICGIFKEVLTISTASIVFKDELSTINGIGLGITILTIGVYNYFKIQKMREETRSDVHATVAGFDIDGIGGSSNSLLGRGTEGYAPVLGDGEDDETTPRHRDGYAAPGLLKGLNVNVGSSLNGGRVDSPKPSPIKRPEDLE